MRVLCWIKQLHTAPLPKTRLKPVENATPCILWKISDVDLARCRSGLSRNVRLYGELATKAIIFRSTLLTHIATFVLSSDEEMDPNCSSSAWPFIKEPLQVLEIITKSFPLRNDDYPCRVIYSAVAAKPLQLH